MVKKDEISKEELFKMAGRTSAHALEIYRERILLFERALTHDKETMEKRKLKKLVSYTKFNKKELATLEKITKFYKLVRLNSKKYADIDIIELTKAFLNYTQMICIGEMYYALHVKDPNGKKARSIETRLKINKQKFLEMARPHLI